MSQIRLSPFVNFQGRAREAMEFYHRVLGGSLDLHAGPGSRVAQARLEADGALIIGSDGHPDYPAKAGDNMAIALAGTDRERLTRVFNALGDSGRVLSPLARQPSGAEVGWLTDRFGIHWTVSIES
jgi:PhnB protein